MAAVRWSFCHWSSNDMSDFVINATSRKDVGKGASRRLRRGGEVPAVVYGGHKDPVSLVLEHREIAKHLENEAIYASILTLKVDGKAEKVILKDLQRHPFKPRVQHADFQRVSANEKLRVHVPIHFLNEEMAPGVKAGGMVSHSLVEVEVSCLPKDLPESIDVDLGALELSQIIHLSDIKLPKGVELVELGHGEGHDQPVATIVLPRAAKADAAEDAAGEAEGEEK